MAEDLDRRRAKRAESRLWVWRENAACSVDTAMSDCICIQDGLPSELDLAIYTGVTFTKEFIWKVGTPPEPVDLTGYTADMKIVDLDGSLLIELSTSNGRITLGGVAGTIDLLITATDTKNLIAKTYVYDLLLTSGAVVTGLLRGSVTVTLSVSA
jgi:hypothetical protein